MRTIRKCYSLFFFMIAALLSGCEEEPSVAQHRASSQLPASGTEALYKVTKDYFALKDLLVSGQSEALEQQVIALRQKLVLLQQKLSPMIDTASSLSWAGKLRIDLDSMLCYCDAMQLAGDKSCERERVYFASFSRNLDALFSKVRFKTGGIYRISCPMALNEGGAIWFSNTARVRNPYFGKKMLYCGIITDTL